MAGIKGDAEISKTGPVLKCRLHVPKVVLKSSLLLLSGYMISATAWLMPAATWPATRVTPRSPFAKSSECTTRSALVHGRSSLVPQTGSSRAFMFRNRVVAVGPVGSAVKEQEQGMQEPPLWLGLDLSTQSLTAAVLRGKGAGGASNDPVVLESVNYEVCACAERARLEWIARVNNLLPPQLLLLFRILFPRIQKMHTLSICTVYSYPAWLLQAEEVQPTLSFPATATAAAVHWYVAVLIYRPCVLL